MLDPSTTSQGRAWAEVRLDRLRENAVVAHRALGARGRLIPMVKADAYGLGMREVVSALRHLPSPADPWAFGVAAVSEGERLRSDGWSARVLVFTPIAPGEYRRAAEAGLTLGLSSVDSVARFAEAAAGLGRPLAFHVEVDTGMGRAGLPWATAGEWGRRVIEAAGSHLVWEGTYTHFHSADEPDLAPTDEQWERFQAALQVLPRIEPRPLLHVANSGAILRRGGYGCDLARPGIFLYGGRAGADTDPAAVVSVRARIVLVRDVEPGSTVGYGATYRAPTHQRWGTLAIGYGDGVPRALATGGGEVLVRGRRVPIIGRVSMDMITIDLTSLDEVSVGEVATIFGEHQGMVITVDEVADRSGTISYEILTGLTGRLPRVYLDGEPGNAVQG